MALVRLPGHLHFCDQEGSFLGRHRAGPHHDHGGFPSRDGSKGTPGSSLFFFTLHQLLPGEGEVGGSLSAEGLHLMDHEVDWLSLIGHEPWPRPPEQLCLTHSVLLLCCCLSRQDLLGPNFKLKISASEISLPRSKYRVGLVALVAFREQSA